MAPRGILITINHNHLSQLCQYLIPPSLLIQGPFSVSDQVIQVITMLIRDISKQLYPELISRHSPPNSRGPPRCDEHAYNTTDPAAAIPRCGIIAASSLLTVRGGCSLGELGIELHCIVSSEHCRLFQYLVTYTYTTAKSCL